MKTNLETYLNKVIASEDGIVDNEAYIKENNLDNKKRINRFKISSWLMNVFLLFIPLAYIFTEMENKKGLYIILVIMIALLIGSIIAKIINRNIEYIKSLWLKKEWEENTSFEYKNLIYPNQGFSTINVDSIIAFSFLADETDFMKRLSIKTEKQQFKFLKRTLSIEGY